MEGMGPIIAHKGEIIARDFMVSYPSGEPAWKPGIEIPDGSTVGMQWGGDITPYVSLASWLNSGRSPRNIQLVLPFIPCSRQDKTGPIDGDQSEGISFILSMLAQPSEVTSIVTLDNHSQHPIDHWRDKAVNLPLASVLTKDMFPPIDMIVAPDAGAVNRAMDVSRAIGFVPVSWGTKKRDQATGRILSLDLLIEEALEPNTEAKNVLVVDDIIDGGYTFKLLAEKLRGCWPNADCTLLCTHGIFSRGYIPLDSEYQRVITTDSCSAAVAGKNVDRIIPVVERLTIERSLLHA